MASPGTGWGARRSVLAPYFVFNFVAIAVALSLLSFAAITIGRGAIERNVKAQMESVAALKEQHIHEWITHLSHTSFWISGDPEIRSGALVLTGSEITPEQRLEISSFLRDEFQRAVNLGDISHIALMDLSGKIIVATDPGWEGLNRASQPYFTGGKLRLFVSDVFQSSLLGQPAIVISSPMQDSDGVASAVLAMYVDLTELSAIMTERAGLAETAETFATNSDRLLLTQLTNRPGSIFETVITGEGITRAVNGEEGVDLFVDYRGEPVIGAYRWIPEYQMALVAKIDQAVAFAPVRDLRNLVILIAGGLFAAVLISGVWSVRRTTRSLSGLAAYAVRIGAGDFSAAVSTEGENEVALVAQNIKAMVDRLHQTQNELEDLYNAAPCGYHSLDAEGRFTRINDTELRWLGYRREEVVGVKRFPDLLAPESVEVFKQNFPRFKESGAVKDLEFDLVRRDGSILPVLLSATAVRNDRGEYLSSRSTVIDYTDKKRSRLELETANRSLAAANAELEAFSYSVSHDLRAPLRSIDGFSQALLDDYNSSLDDTGRDYLNRVRAATQRMGHLIDDMLSLSRVTRTEFKLETVDLTSLGFEITNELAAAEPDREVAVSIAPGINVSGDRHLLRVLLHNLLENAWKFTRKTPDARIEFGRAFTDEGVVYSVMDNGAGFDMKYADKLFSPFQRLHAVSEFPGTGVGLAIARRVVSRHRGRIWAQAEPGKGAAVYFTLDINEGGQANGEPLDAAAG
ncbi:ATP-binding protein [Dehalogenimonas sp. 4OHTPN]|uniref:histidine kinase n=1 Tax=Dehalogenimonas sp. 4OHTPN TaxID=3166643 RepID=A0AAU8G8N3_9CHLR